MKSNAFQGLIEDQLEELDALKFRRMFGGFGIYSGETFFGLIHKERLYFRTNDETRKKHEDLGMTFFTAPGSQKPLKKYYEVPLSIIEHQRELLDWAREAVKSANEE